MPPTTGRSLELYFVDGNPDGMLTAEVFNWTGHVLAFPRTRLLEALRREETKGPGVYLLLGEGDGGEQLLYVGESDDVSYRIKTHDGQKEWWSRAVIVTAAKNLNKAHVRYLESRLVSEAHTVGRATLMNGTRPPARLLGEAARANMESFLEHVLLILPAVGIDLMVQRARPEAASAEAETTTRSAPTFELQTPKHQVQGKAKLIDGEFVVLAGSLARASWEGPATHPYAALHRQLVASKVLIIHGDHRRFAENYAFSSPSAAGAVINGRATNGPETWKVEGSPKTYRQWEAEQLQG